MALVKYNNNSLSAITAAAAIPSGAMTLIKEVTASASATVSFAHGTSDVVLDSTYPIYLFKIINAHPSAQAHFQVNFRDGSTAYDATKTTTVINTQHSEGGSGGEVAYSGSFDLAQSTSFQSLAESTGTGNDECVSGELWLFNPSSTTFVKHFMAQINNYYYSDYLMSWYVAGYCNVTAAIDGVQFKFASGNIDAGTFKLYGIKDS